MPLADYRGFALGLFVELLAMSFGAKVMEKELFGEDGLFIIAIDPKKLGNNAFKHQVSRMLMDIRISAAAPGSDKAVART